jgi:hypothetical protein
MLVLQQVQHVLNEEEAVSSVPGAYPPPLSMKVCRFDVLSAFPALTALRHLIGLQYSYQVPI